VVVVKIRFWGTRGSIATPGPATARYGGNTSCVEVRTDDGTVIVLDCGTGARQLGSNLIAEQKDTLRLNLLIGHTHWDHIQGFPFFLPAFVPNTEINVYAPIGFQRNLEESLAGQMQYSYFPVKLTELRSRIHFTELEEGFFRVGDVLIETQHINHTAPTIAYRITADGATVAYVTDHEPFWRPDSSEFKHPGDQRHIAFLNGADLVIHDAQYTEAEYPSKISWGHSTIEYATDVAMLAGVKRLALFHHDPLRDDDTLSRLEEQAAKRSVERGGGVEVFAAAEGMSIEVRGSGRMPDVAELSALQARPITGRRVLIVCSNENEVASIAQQLEEDDLMLLRVPDLKGALDQVRRLTPDLAIVNEILPDGEGTAVVDAIREKPSGDEVPILYLTESQSADLVEAESDQTLTDFIAKPFSPPMVRTRVRAWLSRANPIIDKNEPELLVVPGGDGSGIAPSLNEPEIPPERRISEILASVSLFKSLTEEQIELLSHRTTEEIFPLGRIIVEQGAAADCLYVILSGQARVVETSDDGTDTEVLLGELGPGEIFGEMGVLSSRPRSASVIAVESTRCLVLRQYDFMQVLREAPELSISVLQVLASRIFDADRRLARYSPDPLTGLASRRAFHDQYPRLAAQAVRRSMPIMLVVLDVVNLKRVNDQFGYSVGDEVLRTVADALMESSRKTDLVARYGSDEFAVLLFDATEGVVEILANRVQEKLAELAPRRGIPISVACALGVATSQIPPEPADELFRQADLDMQRKKGRDRTARAAVAG
jgi:diguanylate cyclase (GGDEF)-like protein